MRIHERVKSGEILISDGAWGTFLQKKGLRPGECPELWNLERPDDIRAIAAAYVEQGANLVESNTFGGNRFKLEHYGLADRVAEINQAGARLSLEAAGDKATVIASMGPTGKILLMGDTTEEAIYESFKEQAIALENAGIQAVCIETMSALDEASLAVKAVRENTSCEVICTFTFDHIGHREYRSMMGVTPTQFAQEITAAGADIIGTNCGNGIEGMIEIVRELRLACPHHAILVHANAGLPRNVDGVDIFPETPEVFAKQVPHLIEAGANIIGGCCGTTPEHIRAIRKSLHDIA